MTQLLLVGGSGKPAEPYRHPNGAGFVRVVVQAHNASEDMQCAVDGARKHGADLDIGAWINGLVDFKPHALFADFVDVA